MVDRQRFEGKRLGSASCVRSKRSSRSLNPAKENQGKGHSIAILVQGWSGRSYKKRFSTYNAYKSNTEPLYKELQTNTKTIDTRKRSLQTLN